MFRARETIGGIWKPSPDQEHLLQAALWQGDAARAAWADWIAHTDLDHLDTGSERLLPLLYLNLQANHIEHPALARLRQHHHYTWHRNHLKLFRTAALVKRFQEAQIPTLLLKASALIPLYYGDPGARPTSDIDILVPTSEYERALEKVTEWGWHPVNPALPEMGETFLNRYHAHHLMNEQRDELDLHRHLLTMETELNGDDDFWAASIPFQLHGVETRALCPADQLLHTFLHGMPWSLVPPIRWVADAYMILEHAEVDWARLLQQAARREAVLLTRNAVAYLAEALRAPIPASVLESLNALPVTLLDRVQYELLVRPHNERKALLKVVYHYAQFQRIHHVYRGEGRLMQFPAFLRDTWKLKSNAEIPRYLVQFTWKRLKGVDANAELLERATLKDGI